MFTPMKRIIFGLAIILSFASCSKKEELPTTYQIFNSTTPVVTAVPYLDGSVYEVIVYHYSGESIIQQDNIDEILTGGGKSRLMDVPDNTDLIKVSFRMLPSYAPNYYDEWNIRLYMLDYRIIERGKNNIIGINGGTYISDTIVKSASHPGIFKGTRATGIWLEE